MKISFKIILLVFVCLSFCSAILLAEEPIRINYTVICENDVIAKKINSAIEMEFKKYRNIVLSEKIPAAELFLFARQDLNDRVNKNGWSFAIAHVSNIKCQKLVLSLMKNKSEEIENVRPLLVDMLKEDGFLQRLNVAHIDKMSDENLQIVVEFVIENFIKKLTE